MSKSLSRFAHKPVLYRRFMIWRQRISAYLDADMDAGQAAEVTIDKVVDLLAGGMTDGFTTQALQVCTAKIRSHTR